MLVLCRSQVKTTRASKSLTAFSYPQLVVQIWINCSNCSQASCPEFSNKWVKNAYFLITSLPMGCSKNNRFNYFLGLAIPHSILCKLPLSVLRSKLASNLMSIGKMQRKAIVLH